MAVVSLCIDIFGLVLLQMWPLPIFTINYTKYKKFKELKGTANEKLEEVGLRQVVMAPINWAIYVLQRKLQ